MRDLSSRSLTRSFPNFSEVFFLLFVNYFRDVYSILHILFIYLFDLKSPCQESSGPNGSMIMSYTVHLCGIYKIILVNNVIKVDFVDAMSWSQ